jgi:hypothetical protein
VGGSHDIFPCSESATDRKPPYSIRLQIQVTRRVARPRFCAPFASRMPFWEARVLGLDLIAARLWDVWRASVGCTSKNPKNLLGGLFFALLYFAKGGCAF